MFDGLAAASVVAVASIAVAILQGRKTRRVNTEEHKDNARRLKRLGKRIGKIDAALEEHLDHHRRNP